MPKLRRASGEETQLGNLLELMEEYLNLKSLFNQLIGQVGLSGAKPNRI